MPIENEDQIRLPISNYPVGTIICHHASEDVRWRVVKHLRDVDDGPIVNVKIQRIGGDLNRGVATVDPDCENYLAVGGRMRGRMRTRELARSRAQKSSVINIDVAKAKKDNDGGKPRKTTKAAKKGEASPVAKRAAGKSGTKSKGKHFRGKPKVPITDLKLDGRNPFDYGSRIHGYYQALLDDDGTTTYGRMVETCVELSQTFGISDTEAAIRRDLNNQTHQWQDGKWGLLVSRDDSNCRKGKSGRLAKGEHDKVIFSCIEVEGVPWKEHVASNSQ
jgi:hypothetical protein